MVTKKIIVLSLLICFHVIFVRYIQAQSINSAQCEEYFKLLDAPDGLKTIWVWEQAPTLKTSNWDILDSLCNVLTCYKPSYFYATYIIDGNGMPICYKFDIDINNDSLKASITNLLNRIKFTPAYAIENKSVISHYLLIINSTNCNANFYLSKRKRSKMLPAPKREKNGVHTRTIIKDKDYIRITKWT